ncbi:MAG: tetratricopeptide repeat protein [Gammaproteobacteria bacterium]|nr:tetratricopeptide repeat protein [Gammaproteobacteria bacterium]
MADFITEVRERRILPTVGVYVAGTWVLIEILERLEERYLLSPYLSDLVFWGLYSLIPAVMLIAWTHGRPGRDKATRLEKVGVPINLIATLGLLLTFFGDKDLDLAATQITVSNELGQQETHYIPSETFRRRMAIFFWDNDSGNPQLDWLQYGITELLVQDLQQNPFVLARSPWNNFANGFYPRMQQAGFDDGLDVPRSLMRKIADRANLQYFVEGSVAQEDGEFVVTARIWETQTLEQVETLTRSGWEIYSLVDQLSKDIRNALDVPKGGNRIAEDLPLVETYGESEEALKAYINGMNARLFKNDFDASSKFFDEAITIDPNFVLGWFLKAANMLESGDVPGAREALSRAQELDYRLPSRDRAQLKFILYRLSGEHEKLMSLLQLQAKIRDDSTSHDQLANMYMITGELEKAKSESLLALERDALNVGIYLRMSDLERATGNMEAAIDYARSYQEQRPEDIGAHLRLGDLLRDSGDLDAAEEQYKQAQVLRNSPVRPSIKLSVIAARRGDINSARQYLSEAEAYASSPTDKAHVRRSAARLAVRSGRIHEAIRQIYAQEEFLNQSSGLLDLTLSVYTPLVDLYLALDDIDSAREALNIAKSLLTPPVDKFLAFSEASILVAEENTEAARAALQNAREVMAQFQLDALNIQIHLVEAIIAEEDDDFVAMADHYLQAIERIRGSIVPGDLHTAVPQLYAEAARALVELGDFAEAERALSEGFFLDPSEPALWVAKARLQQGQNMEQMALASVNYALAIWQDADEDYQQFIDAKALAAELQASE